MIRAKAELSFERPPSVLMDPTFFVMQLCMAVQAIDIAFVSFDVQTVPSDTSQICATDVEIFLLRIPMVKTQRRDMAVISASRTLVSAAFEKFMFDSIPAGFGRFWHALVSVSNPSEYH